MQSHKIDWSTNLDDCCPLCKKRCGYRQIRSYYRTAIELFPYHTEQICIACFRCKNHKGDFSLLPHQLAPYHQYTIRTILLVLIFTHNSIQRTNSSRESIILNLAEPSDLLPYLVTYWLLHHVQRAVDRAFITLMGNLHDAPTEPINKLNQCCHKLSVLCARGPPNIRVAINIVIYDYSKISRHHFLGTASQYRQRGSSNQH